MAAGQKVMTEGRALEPLIFANFQRLAARTSDCSASPDFIRADQSKLWPKKSTEGAKMTWRALLFLRLLRLFAARIWL
jgi:hypothetical protein